MRTRVSSGILLLLLLPCLFGGEDKSKKAYELIYQDVQVLKQQILQIEKKLEQNRQDISIIKNQLDELLTLNRFFQKEQASLKEDQKKVPAQYQVLLEKLDVITSQLSQFSEELMEIKTGTLSIGEQEEGKEAAAPEQKPPAAKEPEKKQPQEQAGEESKQQVLPNISVQEVYNMAYSDYLKGNYELAVQGFQIYLDQFSDSPVADNAMYWIGECYYSQRDFNRAIDHFNELILRFPEGDKIPAAYLKKGLGLVELKRKDEALSVLKILISKYPLAEETKIAQQKIKELTS